MPFTLPTIYPITDVGLPGLSHSEQVRRLIEGGATLIQLREKEAPARAFYDAARTAVDVAAQRDVRIIINDRVDIALALGTGVHLGQDDLPPREARRILGHDAIIGYSTHSVDQAIEAAGLPVDYIAIGPVFSTTTKPDTDPVIGLDGVRAVRAAIGDMPLVAIGGINESNLASVLGAGADSAAVISAVLSPPGDIPARMRQLSSVRNNV